LSWSVLHPSQKYFAFRPTPTFTDLRFSVIGFQYLVIPRNIARNRPKNSDSVQVPLLRVRSTRGDFTTFLGFLLAGVLDGFAFMASKYFDWAKV
jgi:hypothetical protein